MNKFEDMIDKLEQASDYIFHVSNEPDLAEAIEKATNILQTLDRWCDAYPEDIFKPVDWPAVHKALEDAGLNGSGVAADCMRHVTEGFKKVLHDV